MFSLLSFYLDIYILLLFSRLFGAAFAAFGFLAFRLLGF